MGAMAGFFGQLGEQLQEKNKREQEHEAKTRNEMATVIEHLASTAKPQYAPDYHQAAFLIRSTPLGKKLPKEATDIYALLRRQVQGQQQTGSQQPGQQPQGQGQPPQAQPQSPIAPPPIGAGEDFAGGGGGAGFSGGAGQSPVPPPPMLASTPDSGGGMATLGTGVGSSADRSSTITPPPSTTVLTQYTPEDKLAFEQQARAQQFKTGTDQARQIGLTRPADIANYSTGKTVDAGGESQAHWASAGQGIIYNSSTGETKVVSTSPGEIIQLQPGEQAYEGSKLVAENTNKPNQRASDFNNYADIVARAKGYDSAADMSPAEMRQTLNEYAIHRSAATNTVIQNGPNGPTPTIIPRNQLPAGGAPAAQTVIGPSGMPSLGGVQGYSGGTVPNPPTGINDDLSNLDATSAQYSRIKQSLSDPEIAAMTQPGILNQLVKQPLASLSYNHLKSVGLTPKQVAFISEIKGAVAAGVYERAGAVLSGYERSTYQSFFPSPDESITTIISKLDKLMPVLEQKRQNLLRGVDPRIQGRYTSGPSSPAAPPPHSPSIPGPNLPPPQPKPSRAVTPPPHDPDDLMRFITPRP